MDTKDAFSSASLWAVSVHYKNLSTKPYMSIILSVKNEVNKQVTLQFSNGVDNTLGRTDISTVRTESTNFLEYLHMA